MFSSRRKEILRTMLWNRVTLDGQCGDQVALLDCWKSDDVERAVENVNYRLIHLRGNDGHDPHMPSKVDQGLERWLNREDPYASPQNRSNPSRGGLRVVFCERTQHTRGMTTEHAGHARGMTMSESAFLRVEKAFSLHTMTLPAFGLNRGAHAFHDDSSFGDGACAHDIHIVLKAPQKAEVANYTLSLHHDVSSGLTSAFICGEGILIERAFDQFYGSQFQQLLDLILEDPQSWDNPLYLPYVVLQHHIHRLDHRASNVSSKLSAIEGSIGVTQAGSTKYDPNRSRWPEDIDPKSTTFQINSISTEIIYLSGCILWSQGLAQRLLRAIVDLGVKNELRRCHSSMQRLKQAVEYLQTAADGVQSRYVYNRERASLQTNVLFNIISQQTAIINQRDARVNSRIAISSKQDSISMETFTFLTALFLPGTFVAALFSMDMFNWRPDKDGNGSDAGGGENTYVSTNFWIFWVITIPLTLSTMTSWYLWSRHANAKWLKQFRSDEEALGNRDLNQSQDACEMAPLMFLS